MSDERVNLVFDASVLIAIIVGIGYAVGEHNWLAAAWATVALIAVLIVIAYKRTADGYRAILRRVLRDGGKDLDWRAR